MVTYYCFCPEDPYKVTVLIESGILFIELKWLHIDCAAEYMLFIDDNEDHIMTLLLPYNFIIEEPKQIHEFLDRVVEILNKCRCIEVE